MDQQDPAPAEPARERPRLQLKQRDEAAAAKAALEGRASSKKSPFGDAKPREVALAGRAGKTEKEILQEELAKEKFQLRLTPDQIQEKQAAEASIAEAQSHLDEAEEDQKEAANFELKECQQKLEQLMQDFQAMALKRAKSGEGMRPSERRRLAEEAQAIQAGLPPQHEAGPYTGPGDRQPYAGGPNSPEGYAGPRPGPSHNTWSRGRPAHQPGNYNGYGSDGPPGDASYGSFGGRAPPAGQTFWGSSNSRSGRGGPRGRSSRGYNDDPRQFASEAGGGLPGMEGDEDYIAPAAPSRQDRF